jgi:hypothetical protein
MAVMALADSRLEVSPGEIHDAISLRARLAGRWAILFSHPGDFAQEQLEMDRWVAVLSRSFGASGVLPVALAGPGSDPGFGWLGRLAPLDTGSAAVLALDTQPGSPADFAAGALRAQIARSGPRLAMIVDASLRCRRTLSYRLPADLPSPLELLGWAVALRKRDGSEESPCDAAEASLPLRSAWIGSARHPCAQAGIPRPRFAARPLRRG